MKSALVRVNTNWPDVAYSNWREGYEMMKTAIKTVVGENFELDFSGTELGPRYSSHSIGRMFSLCLFSLWLVQFY